MPRIASVVRKDDIRRTIEVAKESELKVRNLQVTPDGTISLTFADGQFNDNFSDAGECIELDKFFEGQL